MIAALYVETGGAYFGLPNVDPWDEARDARKYNGPHPIVAHPPCQRWGRFWHGSTRKPHQFKLGDDGGCFKAALKAEQTGNREFGAQVRAMYLRDMRSRAADLAGDIGEATKLLQHSSQRLTERHYRTKAEKLRAVR